MDKFLVTGGAGFIGSNICRKLVSQGCFVRVVDNLLTGKKGNLSAILNKIEFIEADMGDPEVARAAMKEIDVVLHRYTQTLRGRDVYAASGCQRRQGETFRLRRQLVGLRGHADFAEGRDDARQSAFALCSRQADGGVLLLRFQ